MGLRKIPISNIITYAVNMKQEYKLMYGKLAWISFFVCFASSGRTIDRNR